MLYRKLDKDGDFSLGHGMADYFANEALGVAQAVKTRLGLLSGEWFLDLQEGTPYATHVFGKQTQETYDPILRRRILQTEGVRELLSYESSWNGETRKLTVTCEINTVYGKASVAAAL